MKKNILLISTHKETIHLFNFFTELSAQDYNLQLWSQDIKLLKKFKKENWKANKILKPFKTKSSFIFFIFFIITFLPRFIFLFAKLLIIKKKNYLENIILFDWPEKVNYTLIAKLLKLNIIWITLPGKDFSNQNKFILFLTRLFSKNIKNITLSDFTKKKLIKSKFKPENIYTIPLGIKSKNYQEQIDIFDKLAQSKHTKNRKFFTVGTITTLDRTKSVETLLRVTKKCLTVIPNLQLIIVGNGKEYNKLKWIAKKMEIDNCVWFVGDKNNYQKWFESFDVFVATCEQLKIKNTQTILRAMHGNLPIIGPINIGLEDILNKENGILTNYSDSEEIAKNIIELHRNKNIAQKLAKNSKATVDKSLTLDTMVNELKKYFK